MLLIFMGENCTGKTTVSTIFKKKYGLSVYSGKDYLRFAKNENEALIKFNYALSCASSRKCLSEKSIIYIMSEKDFISKFKNIDDAVLVKFSANLDIIKNRFSKRINSPISKPICTMLEKKNLLWNDVAADTYVDTTKSTPLDVFASICKFIELL